MTSLSAERLRVTLHPKIHATKLFITAFHHLDYPMKHASAFLVVLTLLSSACVSAKDQMQIGFRGLPWGASEQLVRSRYGKQVKSAKCGDTLSSYKAVLKQACGNPVIDPYEVAGIPFKLSFELSEKTRVLVEVSLYSEVRVDESQFGNSAIIDWKAKNDRMHTALVNRFGDPESHDSLNKDGMVMFIERWHTSDTTIEFESILFNQYADDVREQLEITYKPRNAGDEGRL